MAQNQLRKIPMPCHFEPSDSIDGECLNRIAMAHATELAAMLGEKSLLAATAAGTFLDMSRECFLELDRLGLVPAPVKIGAGARLLRWRRSDLQQWVDAGCPPRQLWEERKRPTNGQ